MKKANAYTLYLCGILNENQYLDIVEKEEINEISSDLLDRAAGAASHRPDERGNRLLNKFKAAIPEKIRQEFHSNPDNIKVIDGQGNYIDVAIKSFVHSKVEGMEYEVKCNTMYWPPQSQDQEIFNATLRIGFLPSNVVSPSNGVRKMVMQNDQGENFRIMLNRMNAVKLANHINNNFERNSFHSSVKPTEFPLSR